MGTETTYGSLVINIVVFDHRQLEVPGAATLSPHGEWEVADRRLRFVLIGSSTLNDKMAFDCD